MLLNESTATFFSCRTRLAISSGATSDSTSISGVTGA